MELENQVVSLDLAKRLKELGVKQESFWYWSKIVVMNGHGERMSHEWELLARDGQGLEHHSAFTVAELGEMLPRHHQIHSYPTLVNGKETWDCISNDPRIHETEGWEQGHSGTPPMFSDTEAGARAKMLIYLIENKLIAV